MKSLSPNLQRPLIGVAALALLLVSAFGQDENGGFGDISSFLPLDQPQNEVRIPSLTPEGAIKTLIEADVVTRVDDVNLRLENMVITLYDDEGIPNMRVVTKGAVYNVKSGVLTSDKRTRSVHADFVMEGDGMTFNTETRVGKMSGNVITHVLRSDLMGQISKQSATPQE